MENQREKTGADKTKQLAHKIHNKKHGVVNNINDFLLSGYKESIFRNDCIIKEKNKNLYSKIDNIQCIILNINAIYLLSGFFGLVTSYVDKFRVNIFKSYIHFVYQICCDPKLDTFLLCIRNCFTFIVSSNWIEKPKKKKLIKSTPHPIQSNRKEYLIAKAFNQTTSHANHVERSMDTYLSRLLFQIVINRISGSGVHYLKFSVDCLNEIIPKFSNNIRTLHTYNTAHSLLYNITWIK